MQARSLPGRPPDRAIPRVIVAIIGALVLLALVFTDRTLYVRHKEAKVIDDAVTKNDLAAVKAILKDHADWVFLKDRNGLTPLHHAARDGSKEMVQLLLANKADVNARDHAGLTPLHWTAILNHVDIAELLVNAGADVNAKDHIGYTPLHYAVLVNNRNMADFLRKSGGHE